ncbi:MAG: sulfatase-like hydrolase/transferase [Phycisphaeraceae bacterium]|nr:sulfatase-like hydrolase/transferase [Phycisphaeraceae bacterium]
MTDQHARQVSGFSGDPVARTPNLDRLAESSVRFDAAVCANPVCTASRMTMLTAKEAHRCAAWNNHWIIFPEHLTWPQHFADHGYRTCLVGKMHFGGRDQMHGFQLRPYGDLRHGLGHQPEPLEMFPGYAHAKSAGVTQIPESLLQDVVVSRESLAFVREHVADRPEQPWFLCASYGRPHSPLTTPGRFLRRYRDRVPAAADEDRDPDTLDPYAARLRSKNLDADLTPEERRRGREAYYACVEFVDECIGELIDGLARDGLLDNTIIIYTSDHGEMGSVHGLWGKAIYYEQAIGVPLLMSGPGIVGAGRTLAAPISLVDLFPTTCSLAGLPVPEGLDGVDWSDVLTRTDSVKPPRQHVFSAYLAYGIRIQHHARAVESERAAAMRLVRDERWKYVDIERASPLLFDMQHDPDELVNCADQPEHRERCTHYQQLIDEQGLWADIHRRLAEDQARVPELSSGLKPTTPNQYQLPDGRTFDAEESLYSARWLYLPREATGGIIPQQWG